MSSTVLVIESYNVGLEDRILDFPHCVILTIDGKFEPGLGLLQPLLGNSVFVCNYRPTLDEKSSDIITAIAFPVCVVCVTEPVALLHWRSFLSSLS
jgi:hypothetical protein